MDCLRLCGNSTEVTINADSLAATFGCSSQVSAKLRLQSVQSVYSLTFSDFVNISGVFIDSDDFYEI